MEYESKPKWKSSTLWIAVAIIFMNAISPFVMKLLTGEIDWKIFIGQCFASLTGIVYVIFEKQLDLQKIKNATANESGESEQ